MVAARTLLTEKASSNAGTARRARSRNNAETLPHVWGRTLKKVTVTPQRHSGLAVVATGQNCRGLIRELWLRRGLGLFYRLMPEIQSEPGAWPMKVIGRLLTRRGLALTVTAPRSHEHCPDWGLILARLKMVRIAGLRLSVFELSALRSLSATRQSFAVFTPQESRLCVPASQQVCPYRCNQSLGKITRVNPAHSHLSILN